MKWLTAPESWPIGPSPASSTVLASVAARTGFGLTLLTAAHSEGPNYSHHDDCRGGSKNTRCPTWSLVPASAGGSTLAEFVWLNLLGRFVLFGRIEGAHDRRLQGCGRDLAGRGGEGACGVEVGGDFGLAVGAVGEVSLEVAELRAIERVEGVGSGELVDVHYGATPNVSRNRMSPSRILVRIVPKGTFSSWDTSAYVCPPKYASSMDSRWTTVRESSAATTRSRSARSMMLSSAGAATTASSRAAIWSRSRPDCSGRTRSTARRWAIVAAQVWTVPFERPYRGADFQI
ncbi:MAG: hypothetical protein ACI8Y4_001189 [Candidatus Poriferisodalaceae bacterium]